MLENLLSSTTLDSNILFYSHLNEFPQDPRKIYNYVGQSEVALQYDFGKSTNAFVVQGVPVMRFTGGRGFKVPLSSTIASSDYTIESWAFVPYANRSDTMIFFGTASVTASNNGMSVGTSAGKIYTSDGFGGAIATSTSTPIDQFFHVAMQRKGGVVSVFVNGAMVTSRSHPVSDVHTTMGVGYYQEGSPARELTGYLSELCVTKAAKYTAPFSATYPLFQV